MSDDPLPPPLLDLLALAARQPEELLSLTEAEEEIVRRAERLTDLGLFRIVTARRYRLTEAGRRALARSPARPGSGAGWLGRLFGRGGS
ncbi:hypothetical protein GQF56_20120 [Rhodobacter sphaeroides]|jgi:hypothetical protein|uniref:Uncharacterized protein n=1 Tax=Cereibacter sphaeroides (strain ATCC 17023 / DSM 158 / JCM 6121 / CCUG 31486 / LMG 2827 / NBRC 12203 / NCIMB 8253 / ATH 2.4.1.) TaxID=272943 RepID=Q3IVF1_CERS4|nr:hypothetical protein [Cereibacter sphaeroides]EKX57500.1 hypothetical protein D516_1536 [Rhodobacter sp. AKP1]ABA81483.1 hypothetical protein RSP_3981 [Cereibacter sphaeroides 2.4.1]ACM04293.1 hypothetical protein RSKD131_4433 [Cereibacter sphaeroides KD131]AMJ50041.1 hypothetical protein APX01_21010 [Cereibacter sphaeroides]ANS36779.1 hypothetical protein A3858_21190 [Cereibacter sphaeroides]